MCRVSATNQLTKCVSARKQVLHEVWLTPLTREEANAASRDTVSKAMSLCDAIFCVTDCITEEVRMFPASRAMIASTNDHFESMLFGQMSEATKSEKPIAISGVTIEGFKFLLALSYGFDDELTLDKENCVEVLQCADYFCAQDLRDACLEKLRELLVSQNDVGAIINIISKCKATHIHEMEDVKEIIDSSLDHPGFADEALNNDAFPHCTPEVVLHMVSSASSSFREEDLWLKLVEWSRFQYDKVGLDAAECLTQITGSHDFKAKFQKIDEEGQISFVEHRTVASEERFGDFRDVLAPLLPFIRFPTMAAVFFSDHVVPLEVLKLKMVASVFSAIAGSLITQTPFSSEKRHHAMSSFEMKALLSKAFPDDFKKRKVRLLYRGSEHGFSATKFHEHCNNQGPTITAVRTEHGHVIGGCTSQAWRSTTNWSRMTDNNAFLFISRVKQGVKPLL